MQGFQSESERGRVVHCDVARVGRRFRFRLGLITIIIITTHWLLSLLLLVLYYRDQYGCVVNAGSRHNPICQGHDPELLQAQGMLLHVAFCTSPCAPRVFALGVRLS